MFSDPFTAIMALILLAFIGTLAVFLRIWRELDSLRGALRDIRDGLQLSAVDAAQQSRDMAVVMRELRGLNAIAKGEEPDNIDKCLGELLEHGLPNLAPRKVSGFSGKEGPPRNGDQGDADLFRSLGDLPIMGKK